jgi:hypothetical protein
LRGLTSTSGKAYPSQKGGSCSFSALGVVAYAASPSLGQTPLYKLMYAFVYRLYDPGHFADPSYVGVVPDLQKNLVTYTIRISEGDLVCPGFSHIYATNPFASRTHVLSNPLSDIKVDGKVLKDQLCPYNRRFYEYGILSMHVHSPQKVPGVAEAVCHELIEIPVSLRVSRVKHRMELQQLGSSTTRP